MTEPEIVYNPKEDSYAISIPEDLLEAMNWSEGDLLGIELKDEKLVLTRLD